MSGINTTTFKAHSTSSASTSSAHCKGLFLIEIAKAAEWNSFSGFSKFYNKLVNDINFGTYILNGLYKNVPMHYVKKQERKNKKAKTTLFFSQVDFNKETFETSKLIFRRNPPRANLC